jgi:PKD repeat protein
MKSKLITLKLVSLLTIFSCSEEGKVKEPISDFIFTSDNNFTLPTKIYFTNKSSNAKDYTWDFGDGTVNSNNINPTHEYTTPGVYNVTLIASNGNLFDQTIKEIEIFILPTANFTFSSDNEFKAPSVITFTNTSLNSISYEWTFGDGGTSTLQNPIHTYEAEGDYFVNLKVSNNIGQNEKAETITILNPFTVEQIQLDKLSKTWNIESAQLDGDVRTSDFTNFTLTISGTLNTSNPSGPYNYSVSGNRPDPSPWDASGTWTFTYIGTGDSGSLLRNDGVPMNYTISGNGKLTISNLICSACDYEGARTKAVNGNWTFVFN